MPHRFIPFILIHHRFALVEIGGCVIADAHHEVDVGEELFGLLQCSGMAEMKKIENT